MEGQAFALAITFKGERIRAIALLREGGIDSWNKYSVEAIHAEKKQNDQSLRDFAGIEPGTLTSWGKIESEASAKTGAAEIVLTFFDKLARTWCCVPQKVFVELLGAFRMP